MPVVLCNAGPLMALGKLNRLDLLAGLFGQVQIPRAVYDEVVTQGLVRGAPDALTMRPFWQRQQWSIVNVPEALLSAYAPPVILDPGETEQLALAQSLADPLVLLPDRSPSAQAATVRHIGHPRAGLWPELIDCSDKPAISLTPPMQLEQCPSTGHRSP